MSEYKRLTTNKPKNSEEWLLNVAYSKNGEVYLRGVDCGEDIRLSEYISKLATAKGCHCSPEDILNGACSECDCEINLLNILAIQSAELRNRLAELEDKVECGQLVELPCKVGDKVWVLDDPDYVVDIFEMEVEDIEITRSKIIVSGVHNGEYRDCVSSFVFKTKPQAEARLKELQGEK